MTKSNYIFLRTLARFNPQNWQLDSFLLVFWWWFVVVCGGLPAFHCFHYQSSQILVVICGGLRWFVPFCGGLWSFAVVCGSLEWFAVVCLIVIPLLARDTGTQSMNESCLPVCYQWETAGGWMTAPPPLAMHGHTVLFWATLSDLAGAQCNLKSSAHHYDRSCHRSSIFDELMTRRTRGLMTSVARIPSSSRTLKK